MVRQFNDKVSAYNDRLRGQKERVHQYEAAAKQHDSDLKAYNSQVDEMSELRRAVAAKLQHLNTENAKKSCGRG